MRNLVYLFLCFCPWLLKKSILRFMGHKIGKKSYIGFSFVNCKKMDIEDHVYIGHFNLIKVKTLKIGKGGKIGSYNWITGGGIGDLNIDDYGSIRRFHFIECSGDFSLGKNSIIAGRGSQFFTHGLSSTNLDDVRPIEIGDWCYVGSNCSIVPGVSINKGVFVGMGSVVTKTFEEDYVLLAGAPALIKKRLSNEDIYFQRDYIKHKHLKGVKL